MKQQKQLPNSKKAEAEYNQAKKEDESSWKIIQKLNQLYKVDRILLEHAYNTYSQKQTLQKSNEFKLIDKFYKYVFKNLLTIEKSYLEIPGQQDGSLANYQINKNSVSKFVRDQSEHFGTVFQKYAQKDKKSQISGINITKFIKQLFSTQYTAVINNGTNYLTEDDLEQNTHQTIQTYYEISKDTGQLQYKLQDTRFNNEDILDFLSFWIKQKQNQQFFILYARTKQKLQKQVQYLKQQALKNQKKQANIENKQAFTHPALIQVQNDENPNQTQDKQQSQKIDKTSIQNNRGHSVPVSNILDKYRKNKIQQQEYSPIQSTIQKKLSKKQQLQAIMKDLYKLGCKRRYPLPKGITFNQIEQQSKTMNLEKFINFCNYYDVSKHLSRELLCQMFKLYAKNRLVLDQVRFINIINRMIETDKRIIDLFIKKQAPQKQRRQKAKLSEYKFKLRPINGKSIETVQQELTILKEQKQREKTDKLKHYYSKKMKKNISTMPRMQANSSYLLPIKTNLLDLDSMRDQTFDPQKFFGNDPDEMLIAYQSKIQHKNSNLDAVLSKRLQKGDRVIQKITKTDRNLKLYK